MYYYEDYTETCDVRRLQLLPEYKGMTGEEILHLMAKIEIMELQQWKDEVEEILARQRKNTMDHIAKLEAGDGKNYEKTLPLNQVDITRGVRIYPDLIDDQGFVSNDRLHCLNKSLRLSLDARRKIYVQDFVDKRRAIE